MLILIFFHLVVSQMRECRFIGILLTYDSDSSAGFNLVHLSLFVCRGQICRSRVRAGTAEERVRVCP